MRTRLPLRLFGLALVASCGSRALTGDGGQIDLGRSDGPTRGSGTGGQQGRGGAGGDVGTGGVIGTGGVTGTAGVIGTGGAVGRGGIGGSGGAFGRGGIGGSAGMGGTGGMAARGGAGGIGGRGGFIDTGGTTGRGGVSGTGGGGASGRGGMGATGGVIDTGGVFGHGGTIGTGGGGSGGTIGTGRGGAGGMGGVAGMSGSGGGGTSGTGGACATCRATTLPISARDIAYSATRNEIYASVSGEADTYANMVVVVDPTTSSVASTIPIGSNPQAIALSDDGLTLWVAIEGAHAFRKVTLGATPVIGPLVHLPKALPSTSYYDAAAMAVLPGAPLSVVVAMSGGYYSDVRVFDDGVPRPSGTMNYVNVNALAAGPPGLVFGASGNFSEVDVLQVSASGIASLTPNYGLLRQLTGTLVYAGGRLYADSGDMIDVSNPNAPFRAGSLPNQGPVALRDPQTLLQLATTNTSSAPFYRTDVRIIATGSLSQLGSVSVPSTPIFPYSSYGKIVYAGGDAVAFISPDNAQYTTATHVTIVHDPAFGTPMGGTGGGGTGGAGGMGGAGGTGGAPDPCPGCSYATVQAYGLHMAPDASRNLIYVAAHAQAMLHPSSIVTVDASSSAVTSIVPVGNDPQPLALSDDGSALWVGLAADYRVRRMMPGPTPVPGAASTLPTLLTTGEKAIPFSLVVLPGTPASIAVAVYGGTYGGRGLFILDDGQLRVNYIQPPEVGAFYLTNGAPGYLLGIGSDNTSLNVFRLGAVGVTYESYGGLIGSSAVGLAYRAGYAYASTGEVVDLTNPNAPLPAGRFAFSYCALAIRSATRVMMVCPNPDGTHGPVLRMLDTATFTTVGSVVLPDALSTVAWADFAYLGGDAVALLPSDMPLQIVHAPLIGAQP